eukprot:scaffold2.g6956.t1
MTSPGDAAGTMPAAAPSPPGPTPQELAARGEAPVLPSHVRMVGARVHVAAVAGGSLGPAGGHQQAGGNGGAAPQKKSRSQLKRERTQSRHSTAELCTPFAGGRCSFGDRCRLNHDVEAFLAAKAPELPGRCPFDAAGACPFGITCRWASKHCQPDELVQRFILDKTEQREGGSGEQGVAHVAAGRQEAGAEQARAEGRREEGAEQARAAEPGLGEQRQGPGQAAAEAQEAQPQAAAAAGAGAGAAGSGGSDQGWWRFDGTVPSQVLELPVAPALREPVNTLTKELQSRLRKGQYDFSEADAVLASMGVRVHRPGKGQQQQQRGQQHGGGQQAAAVGQANGSEAGGEGDGAAAGDAGAPAAKRPRLEGQPAPAEPMEEESSGAAPRSDAAFLGALGVPAGAPGTPPGPAPGAAPRGAAPAGPPAPAPSGAGAPAAAEGGVDGYVEARAHPREKKVIDFSGKLYLAPLTTVGNLPFRRRAVPRRKQAPVPGAGAGGGGICKSLGADITCGEMALATNLLQGQTSEWALLKRHPEEDCFGVQVCGGFPDSMARCAQLIQDKCEADFVDINFGCPIDVICGKGAGSACLLKPARMEQIGYTDGDDIAHKLIPQAAGWGAAAITLHGRTREQRYSKLADWPYIQRCAAAAAGTGLQLVGNGDVFSWEDHHRQLEAAGSGLATTYIARGAIMKPWIFTEIKERRHWDISAGERFDIFKRFCSTGLEHWGSDSRGVETTRREGGSLAWGDPEAAGSRARPFPWQRAARGPLRPLRFLLEWLSFTHRYIPVGLLEVLPQRLHWRPPAFVGRSDLETLLASDNPGDWVRISEMLLGPAAPGFVFAPKHRANSYAQRGERYQDRDAQY